MSNNAKPDMRKLAIKITASNSVHKIVGNLTVKEVSDLNENTAKQLLAFLVAVDKESSKNLRNYFKKKRSRKAVHENRVVIGWYDKKAEKKNKSNIKLAK